MARQKKEDHPTGAPAWMATFSDLMNLLLCFFVLLFSMSSVDEEKFEALIASLQSNYSILSGGGSSVGNGEMISAGINQMKQYDIYFNPKATNSGDGKSDSKKKSVLQTMADNDGKNHETDFGYTTEDGTKNGESAENPEKTMTQAEAMELTEQVELKESEQMADKVEKMLHRYGIQDQVNVDFNGQYITMTLNGAILFASGSDELVKEAHPLVNKIGKILQRFKKNTIEIEGHTDNVPIHNAKYEDNMVLSMYRARSVADYIRGATSLNPAYIKSSGRGDYVPIADNGTPEGRAQNRRVEIKVYNTYNSDNLE